MGKFKVRKLGLLFGSLVFLAMLVMPTPQGLSEIGQKILASTVLMVIFWLTEAIPIAMTALLPILIFPLIGVTGAKGQNDIELFGHYAYQTVFLVLGVSFLSTAMVKWNLHRRIALGIVKKVGAKPKMIVLGFILATAVVSMWMSNTTATAMMLPVAFSIIESLDSDSKGFRKAMILCIPYAATIGGMSTAIGTTTNPTGIGLIRETLGIDISFMEWFKIGLPFALVLIPLMWLYFVKYFKVDRMSEINHEIVLKEYKALGSVSTEEKKVAAVFGIGVVLWMTRILWKSYLPFVTDETIAMVIAFLLILIPTDWREGKYLLSLKEAFSEAPWGTYILLGGSMVMGNAFKDSGCAKWVASQLGFLANFSPLVIVIVVGVITAVITEVTTNAVVVAAFLPVLAGLGSQIGMPPLALMLTCMLASNFAFMLPSATPPNAIAYGTEQIEMKDLIAAGFWLKIICLIVFPIVMYGITMGLFGVGK